MLKQRILTGVGIAVVLSLVIIFSHIPWVLGTLIACLSMQAIYELYRAVGLKDNKPLYLISCAVALLLSIINIPGYEYIVVIVFVSAVALFLYLMLNVKTLRRIDAWMAVCIAVIIVCSFKCMSGIRAMEKGVFLLGMAVLVPVLTDIFAYLIGRQCGKHRLFPSISPKKTVEGAIGGLVYAVGIIALIAAILMRCHVIQVELEQLITCVIFASLIGQFGDFALSSVKRIVGIKDYGVLLPGHGGILDRFDSLLFVLPFTYLFCLCAEPILF